MPYNVNDFRGEAAPSLRITNANPENYFEFLKNTIPGTLVEKGIPAEVHEDTAKSGGLFGSKMPMLVISHPNPPYHYFDIGVVVNGQALMFPLLGYSTENTQANKKADAKGFKGLLTRSADEFAMQQEKFWQDDVIEAIMSRFSGK